MKPQIIIACGVVVAILISVGISIYVMKNKNENYSNFTVVTLNYTPSAASAAQLDLNKLANFFERYLPNSSINVSPASRNSIKAPFQAEIIFFSNNKIQSVVPIASTEWYKTNTISVAQLEDAIYNNPRLVTAMKAL
jgi:hypothetical protein